MGDWTITVYGDRDPSPLVGYQQQELPAQVAFGDQDARWVSLAGIARLDTLTNVDYLPASGQADLIAVDQPSAGTIYIITPLVLDTAPLAGAASVGIASYDIDQAQGDFGWRIYFTDVKVQRSDQEGRAEIVAQAEYRGDWGLNRVGFKADLLLGVELP